jgi:hypothetical protein
MRNSGPRLFFCLLIVAAFGVACGSSSPHIPQSVTVTPSTADAKDFPNGQVQFTVTAFYNTMPSSVQNASATWSVCGGNPASPENPVTISSTGVAQCVVNGTYTINAFVPDPAFHGACGGGSLPCGGSWRRCGQRTTHLPLNVRPEIEVGS